MTPGAERAARLALEREDRRVALAGCEPARVLLDLLSLFRDGRDGSGTGRSFADAWPEALRRACSAAPAHEQGWWRQELTAELDVWRRAWERGPQTPGERALARLLADLERSELVIAPSAEELPLEVEPERVCARCHGERGSMESRSPKARFCSERCKRDHNYERERAKAQTSKRTLRKSEPSDRISDGGAITLAA